MPQTDRGPFCNPRGTPFFPRKRPWAHAEIGGQFFCPLFSSFSSRSFRRPWKMESASVPPGHSRRQKTTHKRRPGFLLSCWNWDSLVYAISILFFYFFFVSPVVFSRCCFCIPWPFFWVPHAVLSRLSVCFFPHPSAEPPPRFFSADQAPPAPFLCPAFFPPGSCDLRPVVPIGYV